MYKLIAKYNNLILLFVKLFVSFGATYFLWQHQYLHRILLLPTKTYSVGFWLILTGFSLFNWLLEIKKWQKLAGYIKPIDYLTAACQSLIAFAISLLTPNRLGEYGVKAWFFDKTQAKKILSLSLIGNLAQLLATFVSGVIGVLFWLSREHGKRFFQHYDSVLFKTIGFVFLVVVLGIIIVRFRFIQKTFFFQLQTWKTALQYAFGRYSVFAAQFFLLLFYLKPDLPMIETFTGIFIVYLLASLVPMLALFDWAIKGGVAVYVLNILGISKPIVLQVVMWMWLFNFAIPFVIGIAWFWFYQKENR